MSADQKQSLGTFLKSEREKRGLTIEQTSSATKIGLKILKQLESDQYSELPALPFVRGFIRNYGKFLGLDGDKLLTEYATFLDEHANERPKRDAGHSGYAFERPEGEQSRKVLWGVMAGMLIFGGAVVFLFKPSLKRKHHGHIDKLKPGGSAESEPGDESPNSEASPTPSPVMPLAGSSPVAAVASARPSPSPAVPNTTPSVATKAVSARPSPEAPFTPPKTPLVLAPVSAVVSAAITPASTASPTPTSLTLEDELKKDPLQSGRDLTPKEVHYKVILRTKADIWVRYRADSKQLMKFSLKKDKILVIRAKSSVYVQVSNPDSITIQLPGKAEEAFSTNSAAFDFHGNSTIVLPTQPIEKIEENFKVGKPLPSTAAPESTP